MRIKTFYGTSENAVNAQIWVAVSVYVLVAIIKRRLDLDVSLDRLLNVFSVTLFEKMPLNKGFFETNYASEDSMNLNQLSFLDYCPDSSDQKHQRAEPEVVRVVDDKLQPLP